MAEARAQLAAARARISELEAAGALATLAAPDQVASGAVERRARQRLAAHEPHAPNPAPIAPRARVASNNALLAAEPRRRWADNGTRRVSLGTLHAYKLQAYVRDPTNRDARGRLRMDCGVALDGFVGYIDNHATETGARHSDDEQLRHSVLIPHELLETAYEGIPGLYALVDGGLRQLARGGGSGAGGAERPVGEMAGQGRAGRACGGRGGPGPRRRGTATASGWRRCACAQRRDAAAAHE